MGSGSLRPGRRRPQLTEVADRGHRRSHRPGARDRRPGRPRPVRTGRGRPRPPAKTPMTVPPARAPVCVIVAPIQMPRSECPWPRFERAKDASTIACFGTRRRKGRPVVDGPIARPRHAASFSRNQQTLPVKPPAGRGRVLRTDRLRGARRANGVGRGASRLVVMKRSRLRLLSCRARARLARLASAVGAGSLRGLALGPRRRQYRGGGRAG
jgi:hypothetical protein